MRLVLASLSALGLAVGASAQTYLDMPASLNPNTTEGNTATNTPFMRTAGRVQCFYDAAEAGSSTFLCKGITLRHDGTNATPGNTTVFVITNLTIKAGTTAVNPSAMSSIYSTNMSGGSVTTGFSAGLNFTADQLAIAGPEVWGGNNNELVFPFATPIPISIPTGGAFCLDVTINGNTNNFIANGRVDRHGGTGGQPVGGSVVTLGTGCPASSGAANATCAVTTVLVGGYGPASSHTVSGTGLGNNAIVLTALGFSGTSWAGVPLPLPVPGTVPTCSVYASLDTFFVQVADAVGGIAAYSDSSMVGVPTDPLLNGASIFHQHLSLTPTWAGNPYGITFSNGVQVIFGNLVPSTSQSLWNSVHVFSNSAAVGNNAGPQALVVRVEI
jgi:hypothetical protein